jgi:hypothetical protein
VNAPSRARGPFSANEEGYPDAGVPARADEPPTAALAQVAPRGNAAARFHAALLGIAFGCGCPLCQAAAALYDTPHQTPSTAAADVAEQRSSSRSSAISAFSAVNSAPPIARAVAAGMHASAARLDAVDAGVRDLRALMQGAVERLAGAVGELHARIGVIEAQPMPGGPVALPVEKASPRRRTPRQARRSPPPRPPPLPPPPSPRRIRSARSNPSPAGSPTRRPRSPSPPSSSACNRKGGSHPLTARNAEGNGNELPARIAEGNGNELPARIAEGNGNELRPP